MEFDLVLEVAGMASRFLLLNFPAEDTALLLTKPSGLGECLKIFKISMKQ